MAGERGEEFDGRHVSLSLAWPMDVYLKLRWELRELRELETRTMESFQAPVFIAINGAITAWQIGDWTAGALDELDLWERASTAANRNLHKLKDLQAYMREHEFLVACQQIATAGKHKTLRAPTYQAGFRAVDQFEFHGYADILDEAMVTKAIRTIAVEFPEVQVDGVVRQHTASMSAILADALQWWEATLKAFGLWNQEKLDFFLEKHVKP